MPLNENYEFSVLIVDDEPINRQIITRFFKMKIPEAITYQAGNGKEAFDVLNEIKSNSPQKKIIILTDLNMPVMNGYDFLLKWRNEIGSDLKERSEIFVLSSEEPERFCELNLYKEVTNFFRKPVNLQYMMEEIYSAVNTPPIPAEWSIE